MSIVHFRRVDRKTLYELGIYNNIINEMARSFMFGTIVINSNNNDNHIINKIIRTLIIVSRLTTIFTDLLIISVPFE